MSAITVQASHPQEIPVSERADVMADALSVKLAAVPDSEFLMSYAREACRIIGADFFMICRLNPYSNLMRSLVFIADGEIADNITYSLDGTPCARAVEDTCCIYPDMVAEQFPQDRFLKDYGIAGYAGVPLRGVGGETLGVSLALTRKPIDEPEAIHGLLDRFARRTGHVIGMLETLERDSRAVAEATDGVWDWDLVTGGTVISPSCQALIGAIKGAGPYDLTEIECAIHPDDRSAHVEALRRHLNNDAPFDVTVRIKTRNGDYRWFRSRGKAVRNAKGRPVRMVGCFSDVHDLMLGAMRDARKPD